MSDSVELQEMVFATVTSNLELRSEPNDSAGLFSLGYGLFNVLSVTVEVHSPLIEIASSHFQEPHRRCNRDVWICERYGFLGRIGLRASETNNYSDVKRIGLDSLYIVFFLLSFHSTKLQWNPSLFEFLDPWTGFDVVPHAPSDFDTGDLSLDTCQLRDRGHMPVSITDSLASRNLCAMTSGVTKICWFTYSSGL